MSICKYLDPELEPLLAAFTGEHAPDFTKMSLEEQRAMAAAQIAALEGSAPQMAFIEDFEVRNREGGMIPCRAFGPVRSDEPLPIVILFMGGTYVATSLDHAGPMPKTIAHLSGALVIVPLHRVPPEHRYPAAYNDCYDVYAWLTENGGSIGGDESRICVAGESAGGTLAAHVCLEAKAKGVQQPVLQVLAEPLLDHESETESLNENTLILSKAVLRSQNGFGYFEPGVRPSVEASPLRARSVEGLAPAYILTADLDPLRDEGRIYAQRLRQAGVPTMYHNYDGQVHGFFSMGSHVTQAKWATHEWISVLKLLFEEASAK